MLSRRDTLLGALALGACAPADRRQAPARSYRPAARDDPRFAAIEQRIGGRVGVAAWNTANRRIGSPIARNEALRDVLDVQVDARRAACSTWRKCRACAR